MSRRRSLSHTQRDLWSRLIQERVLDFPPYLKARTVALYSPIHNEVATEDIRDHALMAGKGLFYPRLTEAEGIDLVRVRSPEEMASGRFGILEPKGQETLGSDNEKNLIVFVPGAAFDLVGNRLGRGKGWYDRVLGRVGAQATSVALAYEFQLIERVPTESWDQKVRFIVTERRVIDCDRFLSRRDCVC